MGFTVPAPVRRRPNEGNQNRMLDTFMLMSSNNQQDKTRAEEVRQFGITQAGLQGTKTEGIRRYNLEQGIKRTDIAYKRGVEQAKLRTDTKKDTHTMSMDLENLKFMQAELKNRTKEVGAKALLDAPA